MRIAILSSSLLFGVVCLGCGGPQVEPAQRIPPFELRPVAWMLLLEEYPELGNAAGSGTPNKGLARALTAFHHVVNDRQVERDQKQKVERRRACAKGWRLLSQEMQKNRELKGQLLMARTYLATECGLAQKSFNPLRRYIKTYKRVDFLHYSSHFWYGESLLELGRYESAITQYRWILGEPESPLYPLALLRTAHCHWDQEDRDEAKSFLDHVLEWTDGKTSPPIWVRSLKQQVLDDLEGFAE